MHSEQQRTLQSKVHCSQKVVPFNLKDSSIMTRGLPRICYTVSRVLSRKFLLGVKLSMDYMGGAHAERKDFAQSVIDPFHKMHFGSDL